MDLVAEKKEHEKQKAALGANADQEVKPNLRFKNFDNVFSGLTKSKNVVTMYPIVSCIITYDSKSVITVTKRSDRESMVKQYSLETYKMTFEEKIGGKPNDYIKIKEVEQNNTGNKFCICYLNDGVFKLRNFGQDNRSQEEIDQNEFNINDELKINNYTMPNQNFADPYIVQCFINDNMIFCCLFHNHSLTHHHFFYNVKERKVTGHQQTKLDTNNKNFPYKCFYNPDMNEVYVFYR